jgi:hypothetical protein
LAEIVTSAEIAHGIRRDNQQRGLGTREGKGEMERI